MVTDLKGFVHWLDKADGEMVGRRKALGSRSYVQPQQLGMAALVSDAEGVVAALQALPEAGN